MIVIEGRTGYIGRNLHRLLAAHEPNMLINCAGRKDIPWCEKNPSLAYEANAVLPGREAANARDGGYTLVHISSDHAYASDGQARTIYARSKRLGDELVMAENPQAMILVTGHVYALDCPWLVWLDRELAAGRRVVAYTNRICNPTWIGDLAAQCLNPTPGTRFVLGRDKVNRYELFRDYASVFGYDPRLIVPGKETNPLLIGNSGHSTDVYTLGIYEGFKRLKEERDAKHSAA